MCLSLKHVPMLMERYKWRKRRKRCRRGKGCFSVQIADTVERAGIKNRDEELAFKQGRPPISTEEEEGKAGRRPVGFVQKVLVSEPPRGVRAQQGGPAEVGNHDFPALPIF